MSVILGHLWESQLALFFWRLIKILSSIQLATRVLQNVFIELISLYSSTSNSHFIYDLRYKNFSPYFVYFWHKLELVVHSHVPCYPFGTVCVVVGGLASESKFQNWFIVLSAWRSRVSRLQGWQRLPPLHTGGVKPTSNQRI